MDWIHPLDPCHRSPTPTPGGTPANMCGGSGTGFAGQTPTCKLVDFLEKSGNSGNPERTFLLVNCGGRSENSGNSRDSKGSLKNSVGKSEDQTTFHVSQHTSHLFWSGIILDAIGSIRDDPYIVGSVAFGVVDPIDGG